MPRRFVQHVLLAAITAALPQHAAGATPTTVPTDPITRVATFNAGTTPWMLLLDPRLVRQRFDCRGWYDNNLCTLAAENALRRMIERTRPDVLFLQEMWAEHWCSDAERPQRINAKPYACAASGQQLHRVLPRDYGFACAATHPDNCFAFRRKVFQPAGAAEQCDGRDCGDLVEPLGNTCTGAGRIATLTGTTRAGPTMLINVHLVAAPRLSDQRCRAQQVAPLTKKLGGLPATTTILVGGDFNFDLVNLLGRDRDAVEQLRKAADLQVLPAPEQPPTNRLINSNFDFVMARGWPERAPVVCRHRIADLDLASKFFDHLYVDCRTRAHNSAPNDDTVEQDCTAC